MQLTLISAKYVEEGILQAIFSKLTLALTIQHKSLLLRDLTLIYL